MTYDEIKNRLNQVETALQSIQSYDSTKLDPSYASTSVEQLTTIKESLKQQLAEAEETMFVSTKGGDTKAVKMDRKTAMDLKKDPAITGIDSAKGAKIKEQEGISFSLEETKAIAKSVGKGLLKALKQAGDEVARIKAHRIEENSFDIHVTYKGESGEDEFSFYIDEDALHLVDFSFDKELVNVGVKPSGEAIVHVDHLANELLKHFKSLNEQVNEVNYDYYTTPKHFDICPGAEALRDEVIEGGKSPEELGEWTFKHDELFKLEKAVLKAKKADERHVKVANKLRDEIIHLSRELGIEAGKINYLKGHVRKIEDIAAGKEVDENYAIMMAAQRAMAAKAKKDKEKKDKNEYNSGIYYDDEKTKPRPRVKVKKEGEGDDHHYLKVSRRDYKKTMSILDNNVDPTYVKTEVVDDDGAGNVIIYFIFRHEYGFDPMYDDPEGLENPELYQEPDEDPHAFMYDVVMDLRAHGIDVQDHSAELDEAMDINDPVLMKMRAAKAYKPGPKPSPKRHPKPKNASDLRKLDALEKRRAQIMRDMEQEAEPEGGPIADRYGDMLNKIDAEIAKLEGRKEMDYDTAVGLRENQPTVFDDESFDALRDIILKYVEDPDDAEKAVQQVDDHGLDSLAPELIANLERDPEFEAWYHKLHYGSDADTDYMQRRRAEKDYMEEDTDVGHQDDEPGMLKSTSYEIATYAAKLYKKLAKYDQVDGEVDFPNWWQSKLILAKDYVSKAYHYLDSEEKQPIIDKLALEHAINESTDLFRDDKFAFTRFSMGKEGPGLQITDLKKLGEYIHVSGKDLDQFVKGLMKAVRVFDDMKRQLPVDESAAKIQKAHGQVVAKMKELAKQYKAGDKSVVAQLKDLTAKKKQLEKHLDAAVAGIGKNQGLTELSGDQRNDLVELQNILDDVAQKGEEAREIIRQSFPRMLSKADAYGAFDFGSSANRYDTTLESIIEEIEEYYDEEEDLDEGKEKEGQMAASKGKKYSDNPYKKGTKDHLAWSKGHNSSRARKLSLKEWGSSDQHAMNQSMHRDLGEPKEFPGLSKLMDAAEDAVDFYWDDWEEYKTDREGLVMHAAQMYARKMFPDFMKMAARMVEPADEGKYKSDAQRKAIYAAKAEKNESFKVGDKVTYLGHPGEITKVNKEMTGAITYNVAYNKGNGRTKVTNIYNKGGEIKAVKEAELSKGEKKKLKDMSKSLKKSTKGHAAQAKYLDKLVKEQKATCCGRCGRVHVKGTKCKSPYLKGKDHCRYN